MSQNDEIEAGKAASRPAVLQLIEEQAKSAREVLKENDNLRERLAKTTEALAVLVLTPIIRSWLEMNDPMALRQALNALPPEYLDDPDDAA